MRMDFRAVKWPDRAAAQLCPWALPDPSHSRRPPRPPGPPPSTPHLTPHRAQGSALRLARSDRPRSQCRPSEPRLASTRRPSCPRYLEETRQPASSARRCSHLSRAPTPVTCSRRSSRRTSSRRGLTSRQHPTHRWRPTRPSCTVVCARQTPPSRRSNAVTSVATHLVIQHPWCRTWPRRTLQVRAMWRHVMCNRRSDSRCTHLCTGLHTDCTEASRQCERPTTARSYRRTLPTLNCDRARLSPRESRHSPPLSPFPPPRHPPSHRPTPSFVTSTISTSTLVTPSPRAQAGDAHPPLPPHFARGSVIQLASGDLRRVEDLRTEDFVLSADISDDLKIDCSHLVAIEPVLGRESAILTFLVGEQKLRVGTPTPSPPPPIFRVILGAYFVFQHLKHHTSLVTWGALARLAFHICLSEQIVSWNANHICIKADLRAPFSAASLTSNVFLVLWHYSKTFRPISRRLRQLNRIVGYVGDVLYLV